MKSKLLLGAVGLVIALVLIMQVPVMAAPDKPAKPTAFTSTGSVYISAAGVTTVVKQAGPLIFEKTAGEVVSGAISSSGWPELTGASFTMNDVTDNAILNLKSGTMTGEATGTINVIGADGHSTMAGTYQAVISAEFSVVDGQPVFYQVSDVAHWELNGTRGVFAGDTAHGRASITLAPYSGTLAGPIQLTGTYMEKDK